MPCLLRALMTPPLACVARLWRWWSTGNNWLIWHLCRNFPNFTRGMVSGRVRMKLRVRLSVSVSVSEGEIE